MSANLITGTPTVSSAHFFDLDTHVATRIPAIPLIPGRQLKVAGSG